MKFENHIYIIPAKPFYRYLISIVMVPRDIPSMKWCPSQYDGRIVVGVLLILNYDGRIDRQTTWENMSNQSMTTHDIKTLHKYCVLIHLQFTDIHKLVHKDIEE